MGKSNNLPAQRVVTDQSSMEARTAGKKRRTQLRKEADALALERVVASTAERLAQPAGLPPTAERMSALRERVRLWTQTTGFVQNASC